MSLSLSLSLLSSRFLSCHVRVQSPSFDRASVSLFHFIATCSLSRTMSDTAAAAAASAASPARSKRGRVRGNKLEQVVFVRGLKAAFDSKTHQQKALRNMQRVTSSANKKADHFTGILMRDLLSRSKMLLRHAKKEGLDVHTLHDALRFILPHDSLDLVEKAHIFATERVAQYMRTQAKHKKKEEEKAEAEEA